MSTLQLQPWLVRPYPRYIGSIRLKVCFEYDDDF